MPCRQWGTLSDTSLVGGGGGGGETALCHVLSRRGSVLCTQWGTLSDTCP